MTTQVVHVDHRRAAAALPAGALQVPDYLELDERPRDQHYPCSKMNVFLVQQGKDLVPHGVTMGKWKSLIHPPLMSPIHD